MQREFYRTRNHEMQIVKPFFPALRAGLLFLPFIRKGRKKQKNPDNPWPRPDIWAFGYEAKHHT
jgi:hypothetical protein